MGAIERIEHKLNLICAALKITLDPTLLTAELVMPEVFKAPGVTAGPVVGMTAEQVTAAVLGTTLPVSRLTVVEALAAGNKLTGNEIDAQGCYYDKAINTAVPAVTQKNIWKRGKSIDDAVYDARIAEIKSEVAAEKKTTAPVVKTTAATGTKLPLPAVGSITTMPTVGVTTMGHKSSLEDPVRREIITLMNAMDTKYEIDLAVIGEMLGEHGAKQNNFITLPDTAYPAVAKKLNQWCIAYDLVDDADQVIRSMNGNDPTYLISLMNQLALGTTDLSTVQYQDLYKLYFNVHNYQNQLESHFGKPLTPLQPDPFAS